MIRAAGLLPETAYTACLTRNPLSIVPDKATTTAISSGSNSTSFKWGYLTYADKVEVKETTEEKERKVCAYVCVCLWFKLMCRLNAKKPIRNVNGSCCRAAVSFSGDSVTALPCHLNNNKNKNLLITKSEMRLKINIRRLPDRIYYPLFQFCIRVVCGPSDLYWVCMCVCVVKALIRLKVTHIFAWACVCDKWISVWKTQDTNRGCYRE